MAHLPWTPHPAEKRSVSFDHSTFSIMFASSPVWLVANCKRDFSLKPFNNGHDLWDAWLTVVLWADFLTCAADLCSCFRLTMSLNSAVYSTNKMLKDGNILLLVSIYLTSPLLYSCFYKEWSFFWKSLYMQLFLNTFIFIFSLCPFANETLTICGWRDYWTFKVENWNFTDVFQWKKNSSVLLCTRWAGDILFQIK